MGKPNLKDLPPIKITPEEKAMAASYNSDEVSLQAAAMRDSDMLKQAQTKYPPIKITPRERAMAASYDPYPTRLEMAGRRDKRLIELSEKQEAKP